MGGQTHRILTRTGGSIEHGGLSEALNYNSRRAQECARDRGAGQLNSGHDDTAQLGARRHRAILRAVVVSHETQILRHQRSHAIRLYRVDERAGPRVLSRRPISRLALLPRQHCSPPPLPS